MTPISMLPSLHRQFEHWLFDLPEGVDSAPLRIVWVPMDSLAPFVDEQIYAKRDDTRWHYAAADGSFEADILVDGDGLVVDYPPLFARI